MSVEFVQQIIIMLLGAALTVLTTVFIGWATSKWGITNLQKMEKELSNKDSIAYRAIWLAEDIIKGPGKGTERLAAATEWASAELKKKGINVTEEEIQGFIRGIYAEIESQVHAVRDEIRNTPTN